MAAGVRGQVFGKRDVEVSPCVTCFLELRGGGVAEHVQVGTEHCDLYDPVLGVAVDFSAGDTFAVARLQLAEQQVLVDVGCPEVDRRG